LERGIEIIKQGACGVLHGYHQQTERYVRVLILGVIRETRRRSFGIFKTALVRQLVKKRYELN